MKPTTYRLVRVHPLAGDRSRGRLVAGPIALPCRLGRAGPRPFKREGDGASPVGTFRLLQAFYRADRIARPRTRLPLKAIRPGDGWCDDPADRRYNRPIPLPSPARHERLWRDDPLYDVVIDIAWNRGPIRRGRGSAIFLHLRGDRPTEGCVAVDRGAIRRLLARIGPGTRIRIVG